MGTTKISFVPLVAIHPTELIKDEMRERGLKRNEMANRMGIKLPNLSRLLNKQESITPQTASRLEKALGIKAETWLNLQAAYDRDVIAITERDIQEREFVSIERTIAEMVNLTILFKSLSLDTFTFAHDRVKSLFSALQINCIEELLTILSPVKESLKGAEYDKEEKSINTWVLLAYWESIKQNVKNKYEIGNALIAATIISKKANENILTEQDISNILNDYGIAYSYLKSIGNFPIDSYSVFIGNKPAIVTNHRHKNINSLVFSILQELKHIHSDLKVGHANLSYNVPLTKPDKSKTAADKFAEDILIPPAKWINILKAQSKSLNLNHVFKAVSDAATKNGVNASIALWRYKHLLFSNIVQ